MNFGIASRHHDQHHHSPIVFRERADVLMTNYVAVAAVARISTCWTMSSYYSRMRRKRMRKQLAVRRRASYLRNWIRRTDYKAANDSYSASGMCTRLKAAFDDLFRTLKHMKNVTFTKPIEEKKEEK